MDQTFGRSLPERPRADPVEALTRLPDRAAEVCARACGVDPRDVAIGPSNATVDDELRRMLDLVTARCEAAVAEL